MSEGYESEIMALSAEDLTKMDVLLGATQTDAPQFSELRSRFPHLSWTSCDASDVVEAPFRVYEKYEIHLLDSADHCSQITSDPGRATGIILARRRAIS